MSVTDYIMMVVSVLGVLGVAVVIIGSFLRTRKIDADSAKTSARAKRLGFYR